MMPPIAQHIAAKLDLLDEIALADRGKEREAQARVDQIFRSIEQIEKDHGDAASRAAGKGLKLSPTGRAEFEAREAQLREKLPRLWEIQSRHFEAWNSSGGLKAEVETFVRTHADTLYRRKPASAPKVAVDGMLAAVTAKRAEIAEIAVKIDAVERAPLPVADLLALTVAEVDAFAATGKPSIGRGNREAFQLKDKLELEVLGKTAPVRDFLIFVLRDQIVARLTEIIGDRDAPDALSDGDQRKALQRLAAENLVLERQEEALILAAAAEGFPIPRRADASPLAVLEIEEIER